jgi:hypothetical protein
MKYRVEYYLDPILYSFKFILASMICFQSAVAVIFTGVFTTKMLQLCGVSLNVQNMIFLPCAVYFLWAFCISLIDMNIERDAL